MPNDPPMKFTRNGILLFLLFVFLFIGILGDDQTVTGATISPPQLAIRDVIVLTSYDLVYPYLDTLVYDNQLHITATLRYALSSAVFPDEEIGDINQDGYDDILLGNTDYGSTGTVIGRGMIILYSGKDHAILWTVEGPTGGNSFGYSASKAGDVNHDGVTDLVVSGGGNLRGSGRVSLLSGVDGNELCSRLGTQWSDLGYNVDGISDYNRDGYDDIIVSAPHILSGSGDVFIMSGRTCDTLATLSGPSGFGENIARMGDLDGDTFEDFLILTTDVSGPIPRPSYIDVYSGATLTSFYTLNLGTSGREFSVLSVSRDINFDGAKDFIVGIGNPYPGGYPIGAQVYSGKDGRLIYEWLNPGSSFGGNVAAIADINNDRVADFVVSDSSYDLPVANAGIAYFYSGKDGSLLSTLQESSPSVNAYFGNSLGPV